MRDAIKASAGLSFLLFVLSALAAAQNQLQTGAPPAASGPNYDLSVGYSDLALAVPGAGHVNVNGLDAASQIHLTPRWAAAIDSNYARASNIAGTPHQAYLLTLQAGPVFYPVEHGNTRLFVHLLGGGGLEDGAVRISATQYFHGWLLRPSYAIGGGVEHPFLGPTALRLTGDYLSSRFFDSAGAEQSQNNFRMTVSLVFRLRRAYGASR
jgi:hypothetical protein